MIMTFQVIAMDNVDVALLQLGGTGEAVCQARKVIIILFVGIIIITIILIFVINIILKIISTGRLSSPQSDCHRFHRHNYIKT